MSSSTGSNPGTGRDVEKWALIAGEHVPDSFYGFWTDDADVVAEVVASLRVAYDPS